ncbi:uncharacterized protein ACHE_60254S [Aspergillus chevalieri]|uniref:Uncharacterized protein n=1 Tax=Aspergillus chevalieri TaxID=182096 RepID=A0A7R7VUG3_ASPCH|nr:uncharacterized protein ACHE_60254S [Aspergillus chevalieri]BCR90368.1 hypothetical protein ACHE_60254S [Aspergillus chevalieri]
MAQRRYSNPVRYYSVPPTAIATEPNTLMTTVATSNHSPTLPTITSPRPSPPRQPQRTFILNHPPLGEAERRCPHDDLTPIEGMSEMFHCDECWHKPELGWLWTCTQDVVGEDGLIDPKKCALLEQKAYMSVLSGAHDEDNVKIMIKQRLALLSREEFRSPQNMEQGYAAVGQSQDRRPKDEASTPERQKHVRQKSQRVRFAEENSYRSPSPSVYRDEEEDKSVEVHHNTVPEQQSVASDEDNHAEYVAWLNMITNMRNETKFGQLRPEVNTSQSPANVGSNGWAQSIQGVHAQQQQSSDNNAQLQTNGSQPQAIDRSYITRLRREMHSLDYHEAIADMHKTSRVSPQQLRARHQPEVSRSKSFRSHFQRSHQGSHSRDDENQIAAPVPVRPASHDYSRPHQSPDHHTGRHEQLGSHYRGVQSPPETFRGRALSRSNSHPARQPPGQNIRRVPFVLNIRDPEENQNSTVQVAARAIGYIPKERLSPEYHSPPPAAHEQPSYRTTKPLPPSPPPPPPPRRPRFLFPCGYKICSTCRGVRINEMLPATRYNPEEESARPSAVSEWTQQFDIQEQPMFFRPDFEDLSSGLMAKDGILIRDVQYFLARDNDPDIRGLIASHIVKLGEPSPAPADENLASRMECLAAESLSGGSDNSTDESVDAVGQKII